MRMAYQYASPYIWPMLGYSNTARSFLYKHVLPLLQPVMLWILDVSSQTPALGVVFLLASIFVGFKVMSFSQRIFGYVTFLLMRLSFWGVLALGVAAVWQRGLVRSVEDAVAIGKMAVGKMGEAQQQQGNQAGGQKKGTW